MRIQKIEFENFRNFRERGKITCSTDGKATIIYGKTGDGKTTLHQLFQWIFYGKVHFNDTSTDRLYNLKFESEQAPGSEFEVMGRIDFEHAGKNYSIRRTAVYCKNLIGESRFIREEMELLKMDSDNNWKPIEKPVDTIEKLLPSGLAEYFFFDGERMIADLRKKSDDSAKQLRSALLSMFDLDILDAAIGHIGDTEHKKTVLGKLYLSKGDATTSSDISAVRTNIENVQNRIENMETAIANAKAEKAEKNTLIRQISEQIGTTKTRSDYERQRKQYQRQHEIFLKNQEEAQKTFGDVVVDSFPRLLISKAINDAKAKIQLKIEKSHLPIGITKALINHLISDDVSTCICGNPLCTESRKVIADYLELLPPKSYTSLYHDFSEQGRTWGQGYDPERLEELITRVIDNSEEAEQCEENIRELDALQKKSPDIEELVIARQHAEARISELETKIIEYEVELKKCKMYLKKQTSEYDRLAKEDAATQVALRKIAIMEEVCKNFSVRLDQASLTYSQRLQENIQSLLDSMLTSKRKVSVSSEFAVKVYDNYADESKSEGQFAIVSFAYIGGILKMLKSETHLADKEYPLILDGPFSKLDPDRRQSVVDVIPQFAPQIILFSKDSLQDIFAKDRIGHVWTIVSNDEQNIATVKEGYLWN